MQESQTDNLLNPPLKWAGGKRWQVPYVRPVWEACREKHPRLVEPFCGGLAITLGLQPKHALLNDINPHLINFYRWLKKGLRCRIPMQNDKDLYYSHRKRFNELVHAHKRHTREAASIFYYLNRTGYNGLCRFNRKGEFNVPLGRYKTIAYTSDFLDYRNVLAEWNFQSDDFFDLELGNHDFVYADPPYDVDFTTYSKGGFTWHDQVRTAEWLVQHSGPVILVNQATPRIKKLYRRLGFRLRYLNAPRRISSSGDRTPVREIFATRNIE